MSTLTNGKIALALKAYGFELRLWKEETERAWGTRLCDGNYVVDCCYEEDNFTLAKLCVLGEARKRVMSRPGNVELQGCDAFLKSWKPVRRMKG